MKKQTEDQFLAAAVKRIWNEIPETRYCFFHIASEAKRSTVEWVQLKAKGFLNGIQDCQLVFGGKVYHIELKDQDNGIISAEQAVIHCAHFNQGFPTYIFYDEETLFNFVNDVVKKGYLYVIQAYVNDRSRFCLPISYLPQLEAEVKRQQVLKKERYARRKF